MAVDFGVDYAVMQLAVSVYLLMSAGVQIIIGPLSDLFGRRPVMLWGMGIFCLTTLGCILAPNAAVFLMFRMAQATVAVAMVLTRAIVRDIHPQDRAAAMLGYVTMGMSVVPMISPSIGGILEEAYGWRANFWLLLACGVAIMALIWADLGETHARSQNSLWRQFAEYPELLTSPRSWGYSLASAFGAGAFFAYLGGAPYVGMTVFGLTPSQLGLYFAAPSVGYFFGNWASGRYSARVGANRMVLAGAIVTMIGALASWLISLAGYGSALVFFGAMTAVGIGNGLTLPNATAGMLSVRPHLAGTASGLGGAMMLGGGAALSALAGMVLVPGGSERPLTLIMMICGVASALAILWVIRRQRQLGL
jgi:DHA1 family bicyclomycin/chloramphenicol resistance-like MFS transporter